MLEVYCSRKFSFFMAAVCLIVLTLDLYALLGPDSGFPLPLRLLMWMIGPAMLWGFLVGIKRLITPPLMFLADRRGITLFYNAKMTSYIGPEVFLPWSLVESLELKEMAVGGDGSGRTYIIACWLTAAPPFSVEKHTFSPDWPGDGSALTLDAFTGSVSKEELLGRLNQLHRLGALTK